ncbi:GIY-YIG nuclease family protein [Lentilactobacillus hilgardii]|uniref:GIY-YIG nuclease family protein n=1 Tax=Lentilactobacillus hilgardii TaxID=1588 RepID=UPI0039ECED62
MDKIDAPIVEKVTYDNEVADHLNDVIDGDVKRHQLLIDYPTVYLIYSSDKKDSYKVYVGETNDIERRTQQHLNDDSKIRQDWKDMSESENVQMLVIGHDHFNKSLTLDIENQMMLFMLGVPSVKKLNNRRENEQNDYYTSNEKDEIFSKIWRKLRQIDHRLFPIEREIRDSAIFKASPFHKLTPEQERAKEVIVDTVIDDLMKGKTGQLILVEGEAGSGKTVLLSTIFYLLSHLEKDTVRFNSDNLKNFLLLQMSN